MSDFSDGGYQYFETGCEPEYFVSHIRVEPADAFNSRVMAYALRHGNEMHLLYTAVVSKENAPAMCIVLMQMLGSPRSPLMLPPENVTAQ